MSSLTERFLRIAPIERAYCENWQAWFDAPGTVPEESMVDIAREMLLSGEYLWVEEWVNQTEFVLGSWAQRGKLVMLRLIGESLLTEMPRAYQQHRIAAKLGLYASGDFLAVHLNSGCRWPARPEYYAKRGNLALAEFAIDQAAHDWVDFKVRKRFAGIEALEQAGVIDGEATA